MATMVIGAFGCIRAWVCRGLSDFRVRRGGAAGLIDLDDVAREMEPPK